MHYVWQRTPALPVLLSFSLGIILYNAFSGVYTSGVFVLCAACFVSLLILTVYRAAVSHIYIFRNSCLFLGTACLAYITTAQHDVWNDADFIGHHLDDAGYLKIRLEEKPVEKNKTFLLTVTVVGYYQKDSFYTASGKVNIYVYKDDSIAGLVPGTTIVLPQRLVRIKSNGNPYAFDFTTYAGRQQLYYQGFYAYKDFITITHHESGQFLTAWRDRMMTAIHNNIQDLTTRSVVSAMLLNERTLLHDNIWQAYAATGIVHIISISGMHVQIFLVVVLFLMGWLKNQKYKWAKYTVALIWVWLYVALTNAPATAVRAGLMFTFTSLAIFIDREEVPVNSLAAAALLMLIIQPYWLYNLGMQLSFLCMLSIYLFYKPVRNLWFVKNRVLKYLWEGIALSIAVQILVTPLVLYYFHQFPLYVVLVNIPAGIYSFALMVGGLMIMIFGTFLDMSWLGNILSGVSIVFNKIVFFFSDITPQNLTRVALDPPAMIVLTMTLLLWATYATIKRDRKIAAFAVMFTLIFMGDNALGYLQRGQQDKLIIYQQNRNTLIQKIQGYQQFVMTSAEKETDQSQYLLAPSLYWSLQHEVQPLPANAVFKWNNKTALILNDENAVGRPVDILIINDKVPMNAIQWQEVFKPRLLILDSSFPRWKSKKWVEALNNYNFAVYSVTLQGALVLE